METVNGEWIMQGLDPDDPRCLKSPEALADFICNIGFLPLFSNGIPGFSAEENTARNAWWTDNAMDPWAWRQILAQDDRLAYGKFFGRKAGFVSRECFPVFAQYRRDGYDWEGMWEDGKMKYKCKKILEALRVSSESTGLEMLSCDLKKVSGVDKGFEGALTDMQMQSFLIMSAFRRRHNKAGLPYGWHVAALMTPETKWGHDYVASMASKKPEECREMIFERVLSFFPGAGRKEADALLGIRR